MPDTATTLPPGESAEHEPVGLDIAVIGMAGRFPGAASVEEFWDNLVNGVEARTVFDAGRPGPTPGFVPAGFVIPDVESFDAPFFGMAPREAEITDPQHRVLLECAVEALEHAGYAGERRGLEVGVYVGCGPNGYLLNNILANRRVRDTVAPIQLLIGNEKDYLATRISYKLDLRGPSVVVQSACSTSLLAVHVAARALFGGECDLALAGGVSIEIPQESGYRFEPGGILSPDGHCRPFDARSGGTVRGNGAGIVVLKRLAEAVADGDTIYAVLRGSAINNDGSAKVGFAAPSADGQSRVIHAAHAVGGVGPETIGYIEAHGTATALGDPIEVAALTDAFGPTAASSSCAIGSVKSNIGHLDAAAGVAGMIKATLALHHEYIPPTLHYTAANPAIDFASGPFTVAAAGRDWPRTDRPRRAAVSSFGIGGTNVHIVLEEAPPRCQGRRSRWPAILRLSAPNADALARAAARLARHLREAAPTRLDDVAYTLRFGRKPFPHRMAVTAEDAAQAVRLLEHRGAAEVARGTAGPRPPEVVLMFPGQGTQFPNMAAGLFGSEPVFTGELSRAAETLRPLLGINLLEALYLQAGADRDAAAARLSETWLTQPALFALEYALARQWQAWGMRPAAMIGHSIGEYVAACLAGVIDVADALRLVTARSRLMQDLPPGRMLAVSATEDVLAGRLGGSVSLAAVNRPGLCVLSGPAPDIADLHRELTAAGIACQPLATSHAFHSAMVEPILPAFARVVSGVRLKPPSIPFVSNLTGTWITESEAVDPNYWVAHLRGTVRFADGLATAVGGGGRILAECGPGRSLSASVRDVARGGDDITTVALLPRDGEEVCDLRHATQVRARLWCRGLSVGPEDEFADAGRVPLPTYPFQRGRHWIEPADEPAALHCAGEEKAAGSIPPGAETAVAGPVDAEQTAVVDRPLDERLAALWREALGIEELGLDDNFFALGGDSILGLQIAHRGHRLGLPLSPRMLIEHPTVARLVEALVASMASDAAEAVPTGPASTDPEEVAAALMPNPADAHEPFPLTDIQHAYWIGRGTVVGSGNVAAHAYEEFECTDLDPERLQSALRGLIQRHPMLRATITGDGLQRILPSVPDYVLSIADLRDLEPDQAERRLAELRRDKSHRVMPSDAWPLFDVSATLLPGGRARLHVSFDLLISDAWSIMLFWRELERRYFDPAYAPPPLTVTFRDYVLAENRLQAGTGFQRAQAYWLDRVPTLPDAPSLPLACEPGAITAPRFVRRHARVEAAPWTRLKSIGARRGLTPSVLLCTAYVEVLAAWSETPCFCLNLPAFNRLPIHPDIAEVIGDFTSVLLVEVDATADEPFLDRAQALQRRLWDDIAAMQFSGVKVLRGMAAHRATMPSMPYVFTSLIFPGVPDDPVGGRIGRLVGGISQTPQVWLDCQVYEESGSLLFNWDSVEALFDPAMLDRMFEDFQEILALLAADEEAWTRVDWRDARAARFIGPGRREANATALDVPWTRLHAPFLERAAATPDALAVAARRSLTYADLARASAVVAHALHQAGALAGSRIAVAIDKGWEQIVAVIGIIRAGCAFVPLDPELPRERLHMLASLASVAAIVTVPELDRKLDWSAGVARLVVDAATLEREAAWSDPTVDPDSLAYIIFTSGTTGVPKGVQITHRAAANTLYDINRRFVVTAADRTLAISALSFDLSVYDIFGLLAVGGAIAVPDAIAARDPAHWLAVAREAGVTIWNSVPALMELLASHIELSGAAPLSGVRLVALSGDWIPLGLPDRVRAFAGQAQLVSLGGATEASIWSILHVIGTVEPWWRSIPYGKPLANQTFHVLDRHLRPRPDGVVGHLYIGGTGLATGYLENPSETAARFIVHPVTGERLYWTGDLGRWLPDGSIEFLGRTDTQVKINGFRIEIAEIEKVACAHPAVRASAVAAVATAGGGDRRALRLVGYVCQWPGASVDMDDLRAHLARHLPSYMVPAVLMELPALPLSPNGKIDRTRLPDPAASPAAQQRIPPETPTEMQIAALWRAILDKQEIGVTDNFFECGGDSRQATELVTRIRSRFSADFPLRAAFDKPAIRDQALVVDGLTARRSAPGRLGPTPKAVPGDTAPLSSAQMRLWFHHLMVPGECTYNIVEPYRLTGTLDVTAMLTAVQGFARRHNVLRTTFGDSGDGPVQRLEGYAPVEARLLDLTTLPADAVAGRIAQTIEEDAHTAFDLATGPLFRVRLLRFSVDDHALIVAIHHIVWDGWSTAIMIRELSALYRAAACGRPPDLPDPELRFADVAAWEQERLSSNGFDAQLGYWVRQLESAPTLALPVERPNLPADAPEGAREAFFIEAATALRFKAMCRQQRVTLFMGYLAVWQMLLHWWCGQDDIVVGVPADNREHPQLAGVVGFLVNSLAMRSRCDGIADFAAFLDRVRETSVAAFANRDIPFDGIVKELRRKRHPLQLSPVFRAWFVLHDVPLPSWNLPGVAVTTLDARFLLAVHDIKLSLVEKDGGIDGGIDYRTALFEPATIGRLRRSFLSLVERVAASPAVPLSDLTRTLDQAWSATPPGTGIVSRAKPVWDFTKARGITMQDNVDGI